MEYLLGAVLVATALHSYGTAMAVLASLGGVIALLAAVSGPPLGGWKLLGRRAHHRADLGLIALVALSPLAPGRTTVWILVAEAVAVTAWRLERSTRYAASPAAPVRPLDHDRPVPLAGPARAAGRAVARGQRGVDDALDRLPGGARRAGFVAGRLAARMAEKRRRP